MKNIYVARDYSDGNYSVSIYSDNFCDDQLHFNCHDLSGIFPMFRKYLYDACDKETRAEIMWQIDLIKRGVVPYWF